MRTKWALISASTRGRAKCREGALQSGNDRLGRRLACAQGERGYGRVHAVHAGFDGFEVRHGRHPAGVVAVELDRHGDRFLQTPDQLIRRVRCDEAGHVLDAYGIRAHVLERSCSVNVVIDIMDGA